MTKAIQLAILSFFWGACTSQAPQYRQPVNNQDVSQDTQGSATPVPDEEVEETLPEDEVDQVLGEQIEQGNLMVQWIHGSADCNADANPAIQVHQYSKTVYILRQNKCTNFEAPFIYLILGESKALLLDSGATANAQTFPIQTMVSNIMNQHYGPQIGNVELIVAHSHAHGDHTAGDGQFQGQDRTTVVGVSQAAVAEFFGIADWPNQIVTYDLGNRPLSIVAIPGHEDAHIAVYDPKTALVLTGDSLYPGRLYINQWETYRTSITRMTNFFADKEVRYVLGAHIEMSNTPGQDYPIRTTFQPDEHPLQLSIDTVKELNTELQGIGPNPMRKVNDSFIITPL
ncbi:MBL fold metallo-hydrolase [Pseudobacteriovorax antillogorgiicola]|uniref:Glyoxylase, beta-lactamase superfamily II n=1 Tax=Pseudobacteriovorax antillogorgiicola TaxID=1513793 RepID=A0A1Y6C9A0_9BACT|nr:MBL fold metallo-hydrolase [Pseudobacteriovorax antillogorgiicola]TCS49831.1 glyoxylase-like metal-dependent hydrolase (beta-lactamase superfamily II) [Pseudobacteriovorax antillogorgiicola]SMF43381.1 Glyoxylase, beta-lactamase superfamily II [Pseudobacteriovorax antillogorgiicola]